MTNYTTIKVIVTTILILMTNPSQGQETDEYPCTSERQIFGTQGKQEDRQTKKLIRKEYLHQSYDRYSGVITIVDNDTYKYEDEVLMVYNTCPSLKTIFQKGIFYPGIITGTVKKGLDRKQELDSMLFRNDSLTISDLQELRFLRKSPNSRFFRFWLYSKSMFNPTVCVIELTNDSATKKTELVTFIKESKLTFFKEGWLIL
jgi:hypothetical protein